VKKNRYTKALKHLKSTEVDKKIKRLNEAPTNSIDGVYLKDLEGHRLGGKDYYDPPRTFYPDADGNWPAGIPGDPNSFTYTRPAGYWDYGPGTIPAVQTTVDVSSNFTTVSGENGTNTDGLIRPSDGYVKADLPPNTRNFILGPLVDGYVMNHGISVFSPNGSDYTNIGYIQKDTRQFVLLGRIKGTWGEITRGDINIGFGLYKSYIWKGTADEFTSYNPSFTLEHALWFRDKILNGKFTKAVPYKYSGAAPQQPDPVNPGFYNGNLPDDGKRGGFNDNQGTPQKPEVHGGPDPNLVPGSANPNLAMDSMGGWLAAAAALGFVFKSIESFINWFNNQTPEMKEKLKELVKDKKISELPPGMFPIDPTPPIPGPSGYQKPGTYDPEKFYKLGPGSLPSPNIPQTGPGLSQANQDTQIANAQLDPQERKELKMLLKFYKQGGGGSGSDIDKQIRNLEIKLYGIPISASYEPQGELISESRQRILREIKKPVVVKEPSIQKLQKYRPNFAGKYTPQNTPNVTASKQTDDSVKAQNAANRSWRAYDKHWSNYQSTERMNIIYDNVGHGSQYWDMIVNENQNKKVRRDREIQEQLNIIAHEKAMLKENPLYESPFRKAIEEQETLQADKDPLFKKVSSRLKPVIDYPDKPSKAGYPDVSPPEMVNGWHPEYGQKDAYYNKLDPHSAESMPTTGNPQIDAKVSKAKKIKNLIKRQQQ
jgi:hypothetical protein